MTKPRFRINSRGWYWHWLTYRTGARDFRTGAHVPMIRDGITLPEWMQIWVGPYASIEEAYDTCMFAPNGGK